jgi:hypothetical protein
LDEGKKSSVDEHAAASVPLYAAREVARMTPLRDLTPNCERSAGELAARARSALICAPADPDLGRTNRGGAVEAAPDVAGSSLTSQGKP